MTVENDAMADTATPRPWIVNPQTPNTIITPHGRISVGWSGNINELDKLAEETAALIVEAVNAHDALKAENARLTQGLQNIVARYQSRDPDSAVAGDMHDIARATLEGR